jgi:hypothetical protein
MTMAGAGVVVVGLIWILLSPRLSRAYSWNQRMFRAFAQFGGGVLVVVGTMWMAGIGTSKRFNLGRGLRPRRGAIGESVAIESDPLPASL